ncbi:hypothetical protein TB2_043278 [Malus domestica]
MKLASGFRGKDLLAFSWICRWEKYQSEEETAVGCGKRLRKAVSYREAYAAHPSETLSEVLKYSFGFINLLVLKASVSNIVGKGYYMCGIFERDWWISEKELGGNSLLHCSVSEVVNYMQVWMLS